MILECSLDYLVEEVWGEESVNTSPREISSERLEKKVKTELKKETTSYTNIADKTELLP